MQKRVLFLTLKVFSATGGIEKVSRIAGKALYDLSLESGYDFKLKSMYDDDAELNPVYFPNPVFKGFNGNKVKFVLQSIKEGRSADIVILSHINLLSIGYSIKKLSPETKIVLIAHGIEVWHPLPSWKKKMLLNCDLIMPVSEFTKNKMMQLFDIPKDKLRVVNNCLDPFLLPQPKGPKDISLLNRYGL